MYCGAGGEVGTDASVEYVVDTPVSRLAMLALDRDRALALHEAHPRYISKLARLSPLSCSPKHHVLMGWLDPEARSPLHYWYAKLPWTNSPRLRATRKDANPRSSRARGTTVATRRRSATASTVEPTELIDGLPWLS